MFGIFVVAHGKGLVHLLGMKVIRSQKVRSTLCHGECINKENDHNELHTLAMTRMITHTWNHAFGGQVGHSHPSLYRLINNWKGQCCRKACHRSGNSLSTTNKACQASYATFCTSVCATCVSVTRLDDVEVLPGLGRTIRFS